MIGRALLAMVFGALVVTQAWAIEEGIDYTVLTPPQPTETGDKIEVVELFWYGCPHCVQLEPFIEKWLRHKPGNVEFRRMATALGPNWEPHARAFYAAELLGVTDKLHQPLFDAMHVEKRKLMDEDALVAFAAEQGIDAEKFREAYDSFYVNTKVRRSAEMARRYGVDGVPSLVVNGKYRTSPSQTGGNAKMMEVLDYLIQQEESVGTAGKAAPAKPAGS